MEINMEIIRDTREKVGYWDFTNCDYCENMTVAGLKTGDYSIKGFEDRLCVERKRTVAEIANNVTAAHFTRALERMATYPHKFIICEFSMDDVLKFPIGSTVPRRLWGKIRVKGDFIIRELCDFQFKYGVNIIYAGDIDNAMTVAGHIFKRAYVQYNRKASK